MDYDPEEYYRDYILEYLREQELLANTELVRLLKNGRRRVTKKSLIDKFGRGKDVIVRETLKNPQILNEYRSDKRRTIQPPLNHEQIADEEGSPPPDWDGLLSAVKAIPPGRENADAYHKSVEQLMEMLFYPSLTDPRLEYPIHEGRKVIDITFTNVAVDGFFRWLSQNYAAAHIIVECKNYSGDPANPELDQISGRFSPSRSQVGILACRILQDKDLFIRRCRDTANDQRGFVIPLDDDDLESLVAERKVHEFDIQRTLLKRLFDRLVM